MLLSRRYATGDTLWTSERLPFVQTRIAQALEGVAEERRLSSFVEIMPTLLNSIDRQWKAFIDDRVSTYLDRVHALEEIVADAVDGFSQQIGLLTSNLTATMLAAVAVLIGSFIAAAFLVSHSVPLSSASVSHVRWLTLLHSLGSSAFGAAHASYSGAATSSIVG